MGVVEGAPSRSLQIFRIIGTSIQFAHQHNGWESWTNLPSEIYKMVEPDQGDPR